MKSSAFQPIFRLSGLQCVVLQRHAWSGQMLCLWWSLLRWADRAFLTDMQLEPVGDVYCVTLMRWCLSMSLWAARHNAGAGMSWVTLVLHLFTSFLELAHQAFTCSHGSAFSPNRAWTILTNEQFDEFFFHDVLCDRYMNVFFTYYELNQSGGWLGLESSGMQPALLFLTIRLPVTQFLHPH